MFQNQLYVMMNEWLLLCFHINILTLLERMIFLWHHMWSHQTFRIRNNIKSEIYFFLIKNIVHSINYLVLKAVWFGKLIVPFFELLFASVNMWPRQSAVSSWSNEATTATQQLTRRKTDHKSPFSWVACSFCFWKDFVSHLRISLSWAAFCTFILWKLSRDKCRMDSYEFVSTEIE